MQVNGAFHGIEKTCENPYIYFFFTSGGYKINHDEIWWGRVPGVIDAYDYTSSSSGGVALRVRLSAH
jgi:hypothetical protein